MHLTHRPPIEASGIGGRGVGGQGAWRCGKELAPHPRQQGELQSGGSVLRVQCVLLYTWCCGGGGKERLHDAGGPGGQDGGAQGGHAHFLTVAIRTLAPVLVRGKEITKVQGCQGLGDMQLGGRVSGAQQT